MLCQECPKKPFCSELCPEAIYSPTRTNPARKNSSSANPNIPTPKIFPFPLPEDSRISKTEKKILTLLAMG